MSHLHLFLYLPEQVYQLLKLPTSSVIQTTLTISPNRLSLPTLVSVENIIQEINAKGFELANSNQIYKISSLINNYLVTEKANWQDQSLELNVTRISLQDKEFYDEVKKVRDLATTMAKEVTYYEDKNDNDNVKKAKDNARKELAKSVKSQPKWWDTRTGKLFIFLGKTAISTIWGRCIGTAFDTLIDNIREN
ncbi:hypothetical protein OSCI_10028 [Kamptonema sp. PCC 6506]|nr:hypothetical protein [Kamptonema formosum]CBN53561.1 hypothetical protein OSCI_10028 [Kamptonema sp. PCC 6506]